MTFNTKINQFFGLASSSMQAWGKPQNFVIGRNKTGTTSLALALRQLGITVGRQYYA